MKHGDQIFIHNTFNINDIGTWMSSAIRFALSLDNRDTGREPVFYNHTANVVELNSKLWVFEAGWSKSRFRAEVKKTLLNEWISYRKPNSYKVITPSFDYDSELYKLRAISSLYTKYSLFDVLVAMPIRLLSRKKIWIGSKGIKSFFCSKLSCYLYDMKDFHKTDPEELYSIFN